MPSSNFDVIVVGAGPAGMAAAIALAKNNFSVLALEAGAFPGAENWSGAVYFAEQLADPELLGPKLVEELPFERRLVRRGFFLSNGHSLAGVSFRDPDTFRHCYTCFRPVYDKYIAEVSRQFGVTLLSDTTVTSLIRADGRVIGVDTQRGAFYGDLVFLAEGDASHLVTKEGYEQPGVRPHFLQGIREVIECDPALIEKNFNVGPGEGAAFEVALRNGTFRNRTARLNMGGFLYTNAASISIGLVLPLDNLASEFGGDHNRLMEWFKSLPDIQHWLGTAEPRAVSYGAKIIRGGGFDEIPRLVDHGLAIGGAASGIGTDFPYPNYTGPACAMGKLIARAAVTIRTRGGGFTREALAEHYVAPLKQMHYFKNVEYLRHWPGYVERSQYFFARNIDVALGSLNVWTHPDLGAWCKWREWCKLVRETFPTKRWKEAAQDALELNRAFNLRRVIDHALTIDVAGRWLLNTVWRRAKDDLRLDLVYRVEGKPREFPKWIRRLRPHLAHAATELYRNDDTPLEHKLTDALAALFRGFSFWHALAKFVAGIGLAVSAPLLWAAEMLRYAIKRPTPEQYLATFYQRWLAVVRKRLNLDEGAFNVLQPWEAKLNTITYESEKTSHIKVLRPVNFERREELTESALWHICPAKVYVASADPLGQPTPVVSFENCVKCESCWRGDEPHVDWGRTGPHRLIYRVYGPSQEKLFRQLCEGNSASEARPRNVDAWAGDAAGKPLVWPSDKAKLQSLLQQLAAKLREFTASLDAEPREINADRAQWLQFIIAYARSIQEDIDPLIKPLNHSAATALWRQLDEVLERAAAHAARHKFYWANADLQQILHHHLAGLSRLLDLGAQDKVGQVSNLSRPDQNIGQVETLSHFPGLRSRLEAAFGKQTIKDLEHGGEIPADRKQLLRDLANEAADDDKRHEILSELARCDISMAWLVTEHLLATTFAPADIAGSKWLALAIHGELRETDGKLFGKKLLVSTALADAFLVMEEKILYLVPRNAPGLTVRPQQTIGLAGAKWAHLEFDGVPAARITEAKPRDLLMRRGALDLNAIALGAGAMLLERSLAHAQSRVQFPGLFRDEDGREAIGKFGAIKAMLARMDAQRLLLETLAARSRRGGTNAQEAVFVRLLAADALGCEPGSFTYNAGQVIGGSAYSEDDVFSKFYRDAAIFQHLLADGEELKLRAGKVGFQMEHDFGQTLPRVSDSESAELALAQKRGPLSAEAERFESLRTQFAEAVRALSAQPGVGLVFAFVANGLAQLFALKETLLAVHERLEAGRGDEREVELVKLWAQRATETTESFRANCDAAAVRANFGAAVLADGYPERPLKQPLKFSYEDVLKPDPAYEFGDFLTKPFAPSLPRFKPELLHYDEPLRTLDRYLHAYFFKNFGARLADGLPYIRYIEKLHKVPEADVREMVARGMIRYTIPKSLGGEGRHKADYYMLCRHAMREAEPGVLLTIQVSTSLGTTPILLGLHQDLPRAQKELREFLANEQSLKRVERELARLEKMLHSPEVLKIKPVFTAFYQFIQNEIGRKPAVRAAASELMDAVMQAGLAGQKMDLQGFSIGLKKAQATLPQIKSRAQATLDELGRRQKGHELFLRLISSGQVGAFGLTEPNAGSDSGGVQTRAVLRRVEVFTEKDNSKHFFLDEKKTQRRKFIEADKWDLKPLPPDTDVALLRQEGGREFYEFYELTGAKMWITNGHIAGVFVVYAKTPEGVTGFMVRREAEGLFVGRDEEKMGQRGSPTNEMTFSAVRVPRECIIGIEGRGQINALETLNVGRAGLAVSATAMMAKLIAQTRAFVHEHHLADAPWVTSLLGEMAIELFASESLAFELIGVMDNPGTQSFRVESAIAKFHVTEAVHRMIRAAERIYGPHGPTAAYDLEKHRRDARVLNIYEGTNEVQRFLILRDLVQELLPKWPDAADSEADLAVSKNSLRQLLRDGAAIFGNQLWANPNFQPTFFPLAEMASHILLLECALRRSTWLRQHLARTADPADIRHRDLFAGISQHFVAAAKEEIRRLARRVNTDMDQLRRGLYPPEIRAAVLALQQAGKEQQKNGSVGVRECGSAAKDILVLIQPEPVLSPHPRVRDGQLVENHFRVHPADAALVRDAVRRRAPGGHVHVASVGPPAFAAHLREALAFGADEATLLVSSSPYGPQNDWRRALQSLAGKPPELLLCRPALAETLGLSIEHGTNDADHADFTANDFLTALGKPLNRRAVAPALVQRDIGFLLPTAEPASKEATIQNTPEAAARLVRQQLGLEAGAMSEAKPLTGAILSQTLAAALEPNSVTVVVDGDRVPEAAARLAACVGLPLHVVAFAAPDETTLRQLAAKLAASAAVDRLMFIAHPELDGASVHGRNEAIRKLLAAGKPPRWLLRTEGETDPVMEIAARDGQLELRTPVYGGKVVLCEGVRRGDHTPRTLRLSPSAIAPTLPVKQPVPTPQLARVEVDLAYRKAADPALAGRAAGPNLRDAEVIIDVGFGVRDKERFDLLVTPLKRALEAAGCKRVMIGGTRKVVEELNLLRADQQIGQTGVPINPAVVLALAVSGAPQHMDYIGDRALIIAFNRDPDALLMTLNKHRPTPRVIPIVGDMMETVPKFVQALAK